MQVNVGLSETPTVTTANAKGDGHRICGAKGTISPRIQFTRQLPDQDGTQRFLETGCGGLRGRAGIGCPQRDCAPEQNGEKATAPTNMGQGDNWGASDMQQRVVFGLFRVSDAFEHTRHMHAIVDIANPDLTSIDVTSPLRKWVEGAASMGRISSERRDAARAGKGWGNASLQKAWAGADDLRAGFQARYGFEDQAIPVSALTPSLNLTSTGCAGRDVTFLMQSRVYCGAKKS